MLLSGMLKLRKKGGSQKVGRLNSCKTDYGGVADCKISLAGFGSAGLIKKKKKAGPDQTNLLTQAQCLDPLLPRHGGIINIWEVRRKYLTNTKILSGTRISILVVCNHLRQSRYNERSLVILYHLSNGIGVNLTQIYNFLSDRCLQHHSDDPQVIHPPRRDFLKLFKGCRS